MTKEDKVYAKLISKYLLDFAPHYMIVVNEQGEKITVEYTEERLISDGYSLVDNTTPSPSEGGPYRIYWQIEGDGVIHNQYEEFTQEEKDQLEISNLKSYLDSTDYIYAKCTETGEDVNQVYADVIAQRKTARARIQELGG